jgi:hypothetical protein
MLGCYCDRAVIVLSTSRKFGPGRVWFGMHWQAHRVFKLGLVMGRAGRLLYCSGNCLEIACQFNGFGFRMPQAHRVISESVPHIHTI